MSRVKCGMTKGYGHEPNHPGRPGSRGSADDAVLPHMQITIHGILEDRCAGTIYKNTTKYAHLVDCIVLIISTLLVNQSGHAVIFRG